MILIDSKKWICFEDLTVANNDKAFINNTVKAEVQ